MAKLLWQDFPGHVSLRYVCRLLYISAVMAAVHVDEHRIWISTWFLFASIYKEVRARLSVVMGSCSPSVSHVVKIVFWIPVFLFKVKSKSSIRLSAISWTVTQSINWFHHPIYAFLFFDKKNEWKTKLYLNIFSIKTGKKMWAFNNHSFSANSLHKNIEIHCSEALKLTRKS